MIIKEQDVIFPGRETNLIFLCSYSVFKRTGECRTVSKSQKLHFTVSCMLHVIYSFIYYIVKIKMLKAGKNK